MILVTVLVGYGFGFLIRRSQRSRHDFNIGAPFAVALGLRLAAIAGIGATGPQRNAPWQR